MTDIVERLKECIRKQEQFYPSDPELPTLREAADLLARLPLTKDGVRVVPGVDMVWNWRATDGWYGERVMATDCAWTKVEPAGVCINIDGESWHIHAPGDAGDEDGGGE